MRQIPDTKPYLIEDLRRDMRIKMLLVPRYVYRDLAQPRLSGAVKDDHIARFVATLTDGWERYSIEVTSRTEMPRAGPAVDET